MDTSIVTGEKVARFEAAFNRIHQKLIALVDPTKHHAPFGEVLYAARDQHNVVFYHFDLLKQLSKLRNALVHEKVKDDFYIAEPHLEIVEEIERICTLLLQPPLALSIASQPVTIFTPETPLQMILDTIKEKGYSQFPIYQEQQFIGLVTEGGIAKWLSHQFLNNHLDVSHIMAKDILQYEKSHHVTFLNRDNSIYDLEALFEKSFHQNRKLEAVLITQTGLQMQRPIGIVTSWDLVQIDHTTFSTISQL